MAYSLSYKAPTGKTLKAIIKDLETLKFWDQTNSVWVSTETTDCRIDLTEGTTTNTGLYTGSGGLTAVPGGSYEIKVIDTADADFESTTKEVYPPKSKTVLEVINAVQEELRLPKSSTLTDSMAKIILAKINTILMVVFPTENIFDHMKVSGSFVVDNSVQRYRLAPVNADTIDAIVSLTDEDNNDVMRVSDYNFRTLNANFVAAGTTGLPLYYRIVGRDYGYPVIEVTPPPAEPSVISYELRKSPQELTTATEYVFNPLAVKNGALAMVKQELGRDATADANIFKAALDKASSTEASAISGDVVV